MLVNLSEGMPEPGLCEHPSPGKGSLGWKPYKVWAGDLWECPTCGHQLVNGVGYQPLAEHYQEEFGRTVVQTGAEQLIVKDC